MSDETLLYELWAPKRPGLAPSRMGRYKTLEDARHDAKAFSAARRWLKAQDVVIYRGDIRVEFAGPAR